MVKTRILTATTVALLLLCLACAGFASRVLVVVTEQQQPVVPSSGNGEFIITDLVAAGYPYDLVTYGRFVNMDLGDHDVIILTGYTSPTPVADVSTKCQAAVNEGRKIFINGDMPYRRQDTSGTIIETVRYETTLFPVTDKYKGATASPVVPSCVEKDPSISAVPWTDSWFLTFTANTPPDVSITFGGYMIGFLYPQGGAVCGNSHFLNILDYGKVVGYLRNGNAGRIGFANDRIEGAPIAAFEIHGDYTNDLTSIDAIKSLSDELQVPLTNLLIYKYLDTPSISEWNSIAGPLIAFGSHTRTHPFYWAQVTDVDSETVNALADQSKLIPTTENYFNFSGDMAPSTAQIDQIYSGGVIYGGAGGDDRRMTLPSGDMMYIQRQPVRSWWVNALSVSTQTPLFPSQTFQSDHYLWSLGQNYYNVTKQDFDLNVKYGLYSYGYIHDYMFDPTTNYSTDGVHLDQLIKQTMQYMLSQGAKFIFVQDLAKRLRDYMAGSVDAVKNADGSVTVTATRPGALCNEVKVECESGSSPIASGTSVLSQHLAGGFLYVTLKPEVTSTFTVQYYSTTANWNGLALISLPFVPSDSDPKTVIGSALTGWYAYQPATGYTPYSDQSSWLTPSTNTPGRGFWAKFSGPATVSAAQLPDQTQPKTIHLSAGWNIIGNPFIAPVKWDLDAIKVQQQGGSLVSLRNASGLVSPVAWGWKPNATDANTGSYYLVYDPAVIPTSVGELSPWQGYWMRAAADCDLILPAP